MAASDAGRAKESRGDKGWMIHMTKPNAYFKEEKTLLGLTFNGENSFFASTS